jgi:hypothetical protein
METIVPLWLLPKSRYLKMHVPQSWASFCLPSDWPTDVGNIHDVVVVNLFRPVRNHRILLHIEVDRACVSAFDPLRPTDPGLEEAAKAIVAAMGIDWQQRKWRFVPEEVSTTAEHRRLWRVCATLRHARHREFALASGHNLTR